MIKKNEYNDKIKAIKSAKRIIAFCIRSMLYHKFVHPALNVLHLYFSLRKKVN